MRGVQPVVIRSKGERREFLGKRWSAQAATGKQDSSLRSVIPADLGLGVCLFDRERARLVEVPRFPLGKGRPETGPFHKLGELLFVVFAELAPQNPPFRSSQNLDSRESAFAAGRQQNGFQLEGFADCLELLGQLTDVEDPAIGQQLTGGGEALGFRSFQDQTCASATRRQGFDIQSDAVAVGETVPTISPRDGEDRTAVFDLGMKAGASASDLDRPTQREASRS